MANESLPKIELVQTKIDQFYWFLDSEYGYFLNSETYITVQEALDAFANNKVQFTCIDISRP